MDPDSDTEAPVTTGLLSEAGLLDRLFRDTFVSPGQQFTPFDKAFFEVITEESILKELGISLTLPLESDPKAQELVSFVQRQAYKVFLTVVWVDKFEALDKQRIMRKFLKEKFDDKCLPVSQNYGRGKESGAFSLNYWVDIKKHDFFTHQWRSLAVVFTRGKFVYELEDLRVLPFPWSDPTPSGTGGFSKVWQVGVHKDHIEDPPRNARRLEVVVDAEKDIRCHVIKVAMKEIIPDGGMQMQYFLAGWNREVAALRNIIDLDHPNLIRWIAAIQKGPKHYLMFEWADGGNLRSFWEKTTHSGLGIKDMQDLVRQTLLQWQGLADCLSKLHMEKHFRHGDIKPENILRFTDTDTDTLGTLKIADFGLARRYDMDTGKRGATMTKSTTKEYEAPETYEAVAANRGLSRLTDMWSVGYVLLEHIIWLLYGYKEVARFYQELQGTGHDKRPLYDRIGTGTTTVRRRVTIWLEHMRRDERCTGTAIGRLLEFVQSNLLVTQTRPNWRAVLRNGKAVADPPKYTRASAPEFLREMTNILSTNDPAYFFKVTPEFPHPAPPLRSGTTRINDLRPVEPNDNLGANLFGRNWRDTAPEVPAREFVIRVKDYMNKNWAIIQDNDFSSHVVNTILQNPAMASFAQLIPSPAALCPECKEWDFNETGAIFRRPMSHLRTSSASCVLCKMLLEVCVSLDLGDIQVLSFDQQDSTLRFGGISQPLVSLICAPERVSERLHTGFPVLPESGSEAHFEIVRQWLLVCDTEHSQCHFQGIPSLPTRLIEVGQANVATVRIVDREEVESLSDHRYIALSHPWGDSPHFCSWSDEFANDPNNPWAANNSISKNRQGIQDKDLPATFQDAICTTRALRVPYLWIDSLCLVQDKISALELLQMESVYSSAYCTLAASWATSQNSGFLKISAAQAVEKATGRKREVVTVRSERAEYPVYVCGVVDDFEAHVINGSLNKRGWILQERALARRTVFFTKQQTYWECGGGVRCETMTHMKNQLAEPLGDPFFPEVMLRGTYGQQLRWYQELYMEYSRRSLSQPYDRARAIQGLEKRLIGRFGSKGGHGMFYNGRKGGLLQRGLLWHRGHDMLSLQPIDFPADRGYESLPSWSWMAYTGSIDYVKIFGGKLDWGAGEFASPWNLHSHDDDDDDNSSESNYDSFGGSDSDDTEQSADEDEVDDDVDVPMDDSVIPQQNDKTLALGDLLQGDKDTVLTGVARDFTPSGTVYYDAGNTTAHSDTFKCVVLGREKRGGSVQSKTHYVLVVEPAGQPWLKRLASGIGKSSKCEIYRRVGVGMVPGRCIDFQKQKVERIVKII